MKKSKKSLLAVIAVILLILLYLITFISACLHIPGWDRLFLGCLALTIALPIFLWICLYLYKRILGKKDS